MADLVEGLLAKLAQDEDLHDDLKQPQCIVAMKHWTAEKRLPAEEAEKLMGDYRVMAVLQKISALQTACQRAGLPVPLDKVLRRETSLGGLSVRTTTTSTTTTPTTSTPTKTTKQQQQQQQRQKGEGVSKRRNPATTTGTAALPPATAAVVAPQQQQVHVPETVLGWLHLFSPLIMLALGVMYFVYLQTFSTKK